MALKLVAGSANIAFAASVAQCLQVEPCRRTLRRFPDGELHVDIEESVRGDDVYVIQPTSQPVDEHVMELIFVADACRRAGASRLTAVVPYFGYARQDRRASGREAIGAAVVANLLEAAGFSRVVALDLHSPEIEGFFRIPVEHLSATRLLADTISVTPDSVLVAPDFGAMKLAERYQSFLHAPIALLHKTRVSGSSVSLKGIVGDVLNRAPIVVDDMITTGGTIEAAVQGLLAAGCKRDIVVAATHAVFVPPVIARLNALPIRQIVVTNSVETGSELPTHLQVVNAAPLIADAIGRLHRGESLEALRARG